MNRIDISITSQILVFYDEKNLITSTYRISTAQNGVGEQFGSNRTPRGKHIVRAKIGAGCPVNTVFVGRRPTGEIYTPELKEKFPERDWILTRILWLSGCEVGFNRLGDVDTMRRYIYIHSTPDSVPMGIPMSHGCILMRGPDIIEMFDRVPVGTIVNII
jgi:lipoprotein-anchoring transpeptidase ErfK/SrfK